MAKNRPLLIKGAASDWKAFKKWSLDYFQNSSIGDTVVTISLDTKEGGKKLRQSLREYISTFHRNETAAAAPKVDEANDIDESAPKFVPYMRAWYFPETNEELLEDFPNPPPCFPDKFKKLERQFQPPFTWIFVGPKGSYSPLHRDIWFTCAWMAQFEGRKRFVFFPPSDTKHIYTKVILEFCDIAIIDLKKCESLST